MDQLHLHLLFNHLPIIGTLLGAFVLAYGLWTKSIHTQKAAYMLLIISAIGAGIAYVTGDGAKHGLEHIRGIDKDIIEEHEKAADFAIAAFMILGLLAIVGFLLINQSLRFRRNIALITLAFAVFSFTIIVRTGYLGGLIRHTELNNPK